MKLVKIGLWMALISVYGGFMSVNASALDDNAIQVTEMPPLTAPDGTVAISEGLVYQAIRRTALLPPKLIPGRPERVILYRIDAWQVSDDGNLEQISDAAEDGLSSDKLSDAQRAQPFFAEILSHTPRLAKRRWWVSASRIPEGTPGFEARDHVIDLEIVDEVDPLPAPDNVAAIPPGTELTPGGVGIAILREAPADAPRPTLLDTITVHYAGWTTDGKMFDASYLRQQTATFPLGKLIQGWQEAVPLMQVGEMARIWIPGALGYDNRADRPFAPKGMLVFDVELIGIESNE